MYKFCDLNNAGHNGIGLCYISGDFWPISVHTYFIDKMRGIVPSHRGRHMKRAHIPNIDIPMATDNRTMADGKLEPLCYDGDVLPQQLVGLDIVERSQSEDDNDESEDVGLLPLGTDNPAGDS